MGLQASKLVTGRKDTDITGWKTGGLELLHRKIFVNMILVSYCKHIIY